MNLFYYDKEDLLYKKVKPGMYLFVLGVLLFIFVVGWKSNDTIVQTSDCERTQAKHFSETALVRLLKECNMKYPHIVLAQARLESAYFTSKVFKQNNNMFGMRKARQRITSAQSEKNTYAYYRDWVDCVYDYAMYQSEIMCTASNETEYYAKLGERYAEDSSYVTKLKRMVEEEKLKDIFKD